MPKIKFANWQPDLQELTNLGQQDIKNVFPAGGNGYSPVKDAAAISTTPLDDTALGAIAAQDSTGTINTFAGDATKLYKLSAGAFGDVSKGGGYSVGTTERWEFGQFGQRVIATQIGDVPQSYDMGSSSVFADLGGSPPEARHIAIVRDFVVLGNTVNDPGEIYWSGFNNSAQWTKGSNQCDSQTLQGGGWVQAITGGEVGYIFQERAITRMAYVGPPTIFQFDLMEEARGCAAPGSVVKDGAVIYFYSQDGFYSFDPANGSMPIGNNKVDKWFSDHVQPNTFTQITGARDPVNKLILWSFISIDSVDGETPDTILAYHRVSKEFAYAKIDHELIYSALSEGMTLEEIGLEFSSIEDVPASFDSRVWTGGAAYLGLFDTTHNLASLSGGNLAATLETADFEPNPGRRSILTNVMPYCDTANATAMIRSRERFADSVADTSSASMQSNGDIPVLSSGRFHRVQIDIPAGDAWTAATGLEYEAQDDGEL